MPTIKGEAGSVPFTLKRAVLSFASSPTGTFQPDLEYEMASCDVSMCGSDLPRLVFRRRHGTLFYPHDAGTFASHEPNRDLLGDGWWVRLQFAEPTGLTPEQFLGQIVHEQNVLTGSDQADTGYQVFTALGALHLLRRLRVGSSYWVEDSAVVSSERVATFNARDELGMLVGNRSASLETSDVGTSYVFGGTDTWTRRQAVDYLLAQFASASGYTWTVSGDTNLLDVATDTVEMGQGGSVANALRRILSPQAGLDFTTDRTPLGFEIKVVSLSPKDVTYGSASIPRNPRRTDVVVGSSPDLERVSSVRTRDQLYSKVRVRGSRIVVVFTLKASKSQLVPKWSSALEAEYLAGTGTEADSAAAHDSARLRSRLASVWSAYGAPHPFALSSVPASVSLTAAGELESVTAEHPSTSRETLTWTPLREGHDYSTGAEVANVLTDHEADFRPPEVWLYDETLARFVPADGAGFSVSVPRNDWGVILTGDVPHRLALNNWAGAYASATTPEFDQAKIVATIAVRLDRRLTIEATVEDGSDDGTVKEIDVPGAELWIAAPGTVVGLTAAGALQELSTSLTLRDDRARLDAVMAGAISRYLRTRVRAEVVLRGHQPWASQLGATLRAIRSGDGSREDVGAPITSVHFQSGGTPRTVIRAGYER